MKIVFTDEKTINNRGDISLDKFRELGEVTTYPLLSPEEVPAAVADAQVIICNKTPMNRETLKDAANLKYIGVLATGCNNVDIPYVTSRGITLCNAGSYSTNSVAQHVFALILHFYNGTGELNKYCKEGGWQKADVFSPLAYPLQELYAKTMGIVGYGNIGRAVAKIALAFGLRVIVFNPSPRQDPSVTFVDFDTLLAQSDIITVHCPLNESSSLMFNEETFGKCKRGAFFVNTARGGIVDEEALAAALKNNILGGAALDVLTTEPMSPDCPLIGAPNLILTPHVAWTPLETRRRLLDVTLSNLHGFIQGKPENKVN